MSPRLVNSLLVFIIALVVRQVDCESEHEWSSWSECSRTCDGGAAYQLKICKDKTKCDGESIRYRTCNNQPCPEGSADFRAQQCAAYNDVPHGDSLYEWVPYFEPRDPCSLRCKAKGQNFGIMLAPKVLDGTRCQENSLDMCINGKCRPVGCDNVLGSEAKIDDCGICGGKGKLCRHKSRPPKHAWKVTDYSECSVTCGVGYQVTSAICTDTQTGKEVELKNCNPKQRPTPKTQECKHASCLPYWVTERWTLCSKSCGKGVQRRPVYCAEESIDGRTRRVHHHSCIDNKPINNRICNSHDCPKWFAGEWSPCSVTCGAGEQFREVVCKKSRGQSCEDEGKPKTSQACKTDIPCLGNAESDIQELTQYQDIQPAELGETKQANPLSSVPRFHTKPWSECSATCGPGVRNRIVTCVLYLQFSSAVQNLADHMCADKKPNEFEDCVVTNCTEPSYVQHEVDNEIPGAFVTGKYAWHYAGFTPCTASCLGGIQESIVQCVQQSDLLLVGPEFCNEAPRLPTKKRACNDKACPPRWRTGEYGECSTSCGMGVRLRSVECIHQLGPEEIYTAVVPDNVCDAPKPDTEMTCNTIDCPPSWGTGKWSTCSPPCGHGVQTRPVWCQHILASGGQFNFSEDFVCVEEKPHEERDCFTECTAPREGPAPEIREDISHYVQLKPKRKISVVIGGRATIIPGTTIRVICPVTNFKRSKLTWKTKIQPKSENPHRVKVSKKGALRIRKSRASDQGTYTCIAGETRANITIDFHSAKQASKQLQYRKQFMKNRENLINQTRDDNMVHSDMPSHSPTWDSNYNYSREPYAFVPRSWGPCSLTCGGVGKRVRRIRCELLEDEYFKVVEEDICHKRGIPRLSSIEQCGMAECAMWRVGEWTNCSESLCVKKGTAAKKRPLHCVFSNGSRAEHRMCDGNNKPAHREECPKQDCVPTWKTSKWTQCSKSCGGKGFKTRMLNCVWAHDKSHAGVNCKGLPRPPLFKSCHTGSCPKGCVDRSSFCNMVKMLRMCTFPQYRKQCCHSCSKL